MAHIFTPRTIDPNVTAAAGAVEVVRELGPAEVDAEVGRVFAVRNVETGREAHAFEDELSERNDREGRQ